MGNCSCSQYCKHQNNSDTQLQIINFANMPYALKISSHIYFAIKMNYLKKRQNQWHSILSTWYSRETKQKRLKSREYYIQQIRHLLWKALKITPSPAKEVIEMCNSISNRDKWYENIKQHYVNEIYANKPFCKKLSDYINNKAAIVINKGVNPWTKLHSSDDYYTANNKFRKKIGKVIELTKLTNQLKQKDSVIEVDEEDISITKNIIENEVNNWFKLCLDCTKEDLPDHLEVLDKEKKCQLMLWYSYKGAIEYPASIKHLVRKLNFFYFIKRDGMLESTNNVYIKISRDEVMSHLTAQKYNWTVFDDDELCKSRRANKVNFDNIDDIDPMNNSIDEKMWYEPRESSENIGIPIVSNNKDIVHEKSLDEGAQDNISALEIVSSNNYKSFKTEQVEGETESRPIIQHNLSITKKRKKKRWSIELPKKFKNIEFYSWSRGDLSPSRSGFGKKKNLKSRSYAIAKQQSHVSAESFFQKDSINQNDFKYDTYKGEYDSMNYLLSGHGWLLDDQLSCCYEGTFRYNLKHGVGILWTEFSSVRVKCYAGEWYKDNQHGFGTLIGVQENNIVIKKGIFKNGELSFGDIYSSLQTASRWEITHHKGTFKNDKWEGEGVLTKREYYKKIGKDKWELWEEYEYHGLFHNGKEEGRGKASKKWYSQNYSYEYEGHFADGLMNGYGIMTFSENFYIKRYEGLFLNDEKLSIYGIVFFKSGDIYEGFFDDKHEKNEVGLYQHFEGKQEKIVDNFFGHFEGDVKTGWGRYYSKEKNKWLVGNYTNGEKNGIFKWTCEFREKDHESKGSYDNEVADTSTSGLWGNGIKILKNFSLGKTGLTDVKDIKQKTTFYFFVNNDIIDQAVKVEEFSIFNNVSAM